MIAVPLLSIMIVVKNNPENWFSLIIAGDVIFNKSPPQAQWISVISTSEN